MNLPVYSLRVDFALWAAKGLRFLGGCRTRTFRSSKKCSNSFAVLGQWASMPSFTQLLWLKSTFARKSARFIYQHFPQNPTLASVGFERVANSR
jgi:hypothetical protein